MARHSPPFPYLPLLCRFLLTIALAFPFPSHAFPYVIGDISDSATYSLPAQLLRELMSHPVASSIISFVGYDVSDPKEHLSADVDWNLSVAVAADVPFAKSLEEGVDTTKFIQATTLRFDPRRRRIDPQWKMCATVYLGGLGGEPLNAPEVDGCGQTLTNVCMKQMMIFAMTDGIDEQGWCKSPGIQRKCGGMITDEGSAFALTNEILSQRAFLAYGSSPVEKGDKGSLAHANDTHWLVILAWAHFSEDGRPQSAVAVVRCVRPADGKDGSSPKDPGEEGGGVEKGAGDGENVGAAVNKLSRWPLVVAIGMVVSLVT